MQWYSKKTHRCAGLKTRLPIGYYKSLENCVECFLIPLTFLKRSRRKET